MLYNEIEDYIIKEEAASILQLDFFNDVTILKTLDKLKIRKKLIGGTGRRAYFNKSDIEIVKLNVVEFFDKHYTRSEVEEWLPRKYIEKNIKSVAVPEGYSLALWRERAKDGKYRKVTLAYNKEDVDAHVAAYDTRYRTEFDKTGFISKAEAIKILELDVFKDENCVRVLNKIKVEKLIEKNKSFYKKIDIENVVRQVNDFFKECIVRQEFNNIKDKHKYDVEKVLIPEGYNSILLKSRMLDKGYDINSYKYAYKIKLKENIDLRKYINRYDVTKITDFRVEYLDNTILKKYPIEVIAYGKDKYYEKKGVEEIIRKQVEINKEYINKIDAKKIYLKGINKKYIDTLPEYECPIELKTKSNRYKVYGSNNMVWKISDIISLIVEVKKLEQEAKEEKGPKKVKKVKETKKAKKDKEIEKISNDYYTHAQTIEITKFSKEYFQDVILRNYDIDIINEGNRNYYRKVDIDAIVNEQKEAQKVYICIADAVKRYFNGGYSSSLYRLKRQTPPKSFITLGMSRKGAILKKADVEELLNNLSTQRKMSERRALVTKGVAPFDILIQNLEVHPKWSGFDKKSTYTNKKWFEYVNGYLNKTNSKGKVLATLIKDFVDMTIIIKDFIERFNKAEIYMVTTNEIKLYLRGMHFVKQKIMLYRFLNWLSSELTIENKFHLKKYNIKSIKNPAKERNTSVDFNKEDDGMYDFETYSSVFKYACNLNLHKTKAIDEIVDKNSCIYASTWLYVMLHLNNAWRHGDVRDFPLIEVNDLLIKWNIEDITWFKNNSLSIEDSRMVIEKVRQWEFIISKTQMKGRFFCSDELAPAMATCIMILSVYSKSIIIQENQRLLHFNTRYNEVNKAMMKKFFKNIEIENFVFKSRKFNKSVMNFITYLANMTGDKKALEYAKWMRSHLNISSTIHYFNFNVNDVESLSKMLFERGEFGYIPALLLGKLNSGQTQNFEEATNQIYAINQMFGDVVTMSTTIGFLNTIRGERAEVVKYITNMSLEECQTKMVELFSRRLPSKEGVDIQCLVSKRGCQKTHLNSCFECPYHIPSIYALSALCDSIKRDILTYKDSSKIKKLKIIVSVSKKKIVIAEAMKKFGAEYVLGCLNMTREEFINAISEIPKPEEVFLQ